MTRAFVFLMIPLLLICVRAKAGEPVDLLPTTDRGSSQESDSGTGSKYILDAAWIVADPLGEFDSSLGAAGALNRALSFYFSGHASDRQLKVERDLISEHGRDGVDWAPFAVRVFSEIMVDIDIPLPEPVELKPFDLTPSEPPTVSPDNPHIVSVRYDDEEYLERLLQRLYFKLIQGPVLLTVPYSGGDERVPEEYRNWNNFRYASDDNVMQWDDTRLVWVDWDLTQTVVLRYEDGLIACYDSGRKYYIDHTAAVAAAGAMLAHPDIDRYAPDGCLNFVLTSVDNE